jgi:hypothetical protein
VATQDDHAVKGAKNQSLIRAVNEHVEEVAREVANPEFLCECADAQCIETVELSIMEYESIRSSPVRFPIKPGHDYPEFERVVEENERYAIVEKFGKAGEIARREDPRSVAGSDPRIAEDTQG